ncbi:MAG TPA: response regulator, partial [Candidatus Polarisedimenticolaceae bacterium]|nr:response regulator [Candidatus Polarisedimenticolaceae bacterium]
MKLLIIEDEQKIAAALKRGLQREGYVVDTEDNGDDGLDSGLSGDYNLIVLDRMLPGSMEGVEVCRKLREGKINTPVIMLTAKDAVVDRI